MSPRLLPTAALSAALVGVLFLGSPSGASAQEPPDTVRVDSTRVRIFEQLESLARPPGIDSTWLVPDSLLTDSARAVRQARLTGRPVPQQAAPRASLGAVDSVMTALMELKGYTVTEYASAGADFEARDKQLVLKATPENEARLIRDGEELTADSALIFSDETGKVWTRGKEAIYQPKEGDPVNSARIVFDLNQGRGTATEARTRYNAGMGEWNLQGNELLVGEDAVYGHTVLFTSCDEEVPHYHFASDKIKIVGDNILVARPVKLYFADVPVMWLPFIATSTETGRASGLLTPTFSVNDIVRASSSYSRRISNIGFYWAASQYWDMTVAMDWWSGEQTSLTGALQFNWARQFLTGNINWRQFWSDDGSTNLAFDTGGTWQQSERTSLRFRARYASSNDLVRRTSFDPREVVQSIDSEGGLTHRFSFGNLTLAGNRRQYLSDDRVEMTLPDVRFSLTPKTFFQASPSQARFYNNVTWTGSTSFRRSLADRVAQPDSTFSISQADVANTQASMNSSLTLGNLSVSSGVQMKEGLVQDVPIGYDPETNTSLRYEDQTDTDVTWNASMGYQQRLVGSTTFTPNLSFSGRLLRSDSDSLANDFVSAPARLSLGATLKSDIYGFFPGFGSFDAIRHKISPSFTFQYSPKVTSDPIQEAVFGATEIRRQRTLGINLNQTFEARLKDEAAESRALELDSMRVDSLNLVADSLRTYLRMSGAVTGDTLSMRVDSMISEIDSLLADTAAASQAQREAQKVLLLSLQTSAMTYDFEKADEEGNWLWGFQNVSLSNTVSSDYLRGLTIRVTHDLFEDQATAGGGDGGATTSTRKFSPHLSNLNFGFAVSNQTALFQKLASLFRGGEEAGDSVVVVQGPEEEETDPFASGPLDQASTIPGGGGPQGGGPRRSGVGRVGEWRANLRYSLQRPRDSTRPSNQMIQSTLTFTPTEKWEVSWRTGYDVTNQSFTDHSIRLTRNLHRWEAYFDFLQTATGNWSFRFEVSLTDQQDLHFDYQQRSVQGRQTSARRPGF